MFRVVRVRVFPHVAGLLALTAAGVLPAAASAASPKLGSRTLRSGMRGPDVRQRHEHEAGRITGGRLIELGELSAHAGEIDRGRPVVFYCRSGSRSAMATEAFAQAGYDAHNMSGGLLEWEARGLPIEPDGGRVVEA